MTKEPLQTLILLLAAMDISPMELKYLLSNLQSISLQSLLARISEVQYSARLPEKWIDYKRGTSNTRASITNDSTVETRVLRLLQEEAGLTTGIAASLLADKLIAERSLARQDIPPLSKKSLRDWIRRLQTRVDPKELLRCATLIRNEFIHTSPTDWVLKDSRK